jgi:hypothetical protein
LLLGNAANSITARAAIHGTTFSRLLTGAETVSARNHAVFRTGLRTVPDLSTDVVTAPAAIHRTTLPLLALATNAVAAVHRAILVLAVCQVGIK